MSMSNRDRLLETLAMLLPFVAFGLQWTFWSFLQPFAWFLFYPVIFISAWLGGLRVGLFSTFTSVAIVWWFFIPPQFSFSLSSPSALLSIGVFSLCGIVFSITLGHQREIIRQAHKINSTLRYSEERYRELFDTMDEGFCVIEMLYDQDGKAVDYRFVEINKAFESQTGLLNALGKTIREMVPNHDAAWFEIYGKVAKTGEAVRFENPANAMRRHYDVFAARIGGDGSQQVGIIFKDVTERKQGELALMAAKEQAELANRAKDSFLATMSHEIRTPLTGMLGMLEVLSLSQLGREQSETLNAAWDSGRSLLRIVSDILDWSKIEEGKLEISPRPTSIHQLIQEVANTYSRVASAKSLMILQHIDPRLSAAHIVDPLRLSQVLNNFVSNAIKFTEHGEIKLRVELLSQLDSGETVRFSVKDTGIGMSKEVQKHVFQRYRQESADTARMYGGTGLGLAICRRLAEFMDGKIELESELGKGSTFSITLNLPVSCADVETVQNLHPEVEQKAVEPLFESSATAPLVLAVDDHPINRELLARQLEILGLRAEIAENGRIALSMWQAGVYALVITDCHMPEMDGYALAQAIRQAEAENNLARKPIVAWTANALVEENELCKAAGMDDLLVKPASLVQLKEVLIKWLPNTGKIRSPSAVPQHHHADDESDQLIAPIDFAMLREIAPDSVEQARLLQDFLAYIRADNLRLFDLLAVGDHLNVGRAAHRMKGSSRMVGANQLAKIYTAIEKAAHNADMDAARAAMMSLVEAVSTFETCLMETEVSTGEM